MVSQQATSVRCFRISIRASERVAERCTVGMQRMGGWVGAQVGVFTKFLTSSEF